jgi:hypothetical protein
MTAPRRTATTALPHLRVVRVSNEPFINMLVSFRTASTCSFARRATDGCCIAAPALLGTSTYSLLSASIGAKWAARLAG